MDVSGILAIICSVIGIIGSVLPALPGPPLSWVGLLLVYIGGQKDPGPDSMPLKILIIFLVVTVIVQIIDYVVPMYFTKLTGGSKFAARGAMVGLLLGMFLTPVGMILGSFLGAFLSELYWARKDAGGAFKSALGSFAGFLAGTGLKIIACCIMLYYTIHFM